MAESRLSGLRCEKAESGLSAYDPIYGVPADQIDATFRTAYTNAHTAQLTRIDNSFHFVMLDQPEEFAQTVRAFLNAGE